MSEAAAPPVETLFREVRRRGLRVLNLFQLDCGLWRANLRSADGHAFYEFGNGVDAAHALEEALRKSKDLAPAAVRPYPPDDERAPDSPATDDEDLIG